MAVVAKPKDPEVSDAIPSFAILPLTAAEIDHWTMEMSAIRNRRQLSSTRLGEPTDVAVNTSKLFNKVFAVGGVHGFGSDPIRSIAMLVSPLGAVIRLCSLPAPSTIENRFPCRIWKVTPFPGRPLATRFALKPATQVLLVTSYACQSAP